MMKAKLVPIDGGHPIHLAERVTIVGRQERKCNVNLSDPRVSQVHCVIRQTDDDEFELRDLGSTNGTRVNGHRVTECMLMPDDELTFAREKFRIVWHSNPDDKHVVTSPETGLQMESHNVVHHSHTDSFSWENGNHKHLYLTKSKQRNLDQVLLDDDGPKPISEGKTKVMNNSGNHETSGTDDEPTQIRTPAGPTEKRPIHRCPHCTQSYLIASQFRVWELPLKLLMFGPFHCPRCLDRFIRLDV